MTNIAMSGALGRMGTRILHLANESQSYKISGAFEAAGSKQLGKDLGEVLGFGKPAGVKISVVSASALKTSDAVIDFSTPAGTAVCLDAALEAKKAIVIGTTGIEGALSKRIQEAAKTIPVIFSPNMSLGANFLFELVRLTASKLGADYDIEIVEAHHRLKKDAPSGTAKKIAEVICQAKGWDLQKAARYGRQGMTGERSRQELGIHVVRGGDTVGEHTIYFSGPGETIELKHTALSRDAFAKGALVAAAFLSKKKNGLYTMADVLK
jgi:4-hydroxy-tetrahydrodipicolinate reductase